MAVRLPYTEAALIIAGFDPGLSGAVCAYHCADEDGPEFVADAIDLPILEDGTKNEIDVPRLCAWIRTINPDIAVIENVQPMPSIPGAGGVRRSMGAASSFRFGLAVGQLRGAVAALGIRIEKVHPQVWKRFYGLKGGEKEPSRQLALQLFPQSEYLMKRKKDHQRAEAILIARYWDLKTRHGRNF